MSNNLIAVELSVKSELSKSGRRLLGWLRFRSAKSKKPWIKVNLQEFVAMSGVSLRTARRQLEIIRTCPKHNVIIRTIYENQKWHILASTCERLEKLQRVEPFTQNENGKERIVKIRKHGKRLNENQMILGKDASFWKAESDDEMKQDDAQDSKSNASEHPLQTNFFGKLNKPFAKCHFFKVNRRVHQDGQRSKHAKCEFGHRLTNLSHWIARNELRPLHWDNAKPRYEGNFAFFYVRESLRKGAKRKHIVKAYDIALHQAHQDAVDLGETQPGVFRASSTISKARKLLAESECYGLWKPNSSKEVELTHWSG